MSLAACDVREDSNEGRVVWREGGREGMEGGKDGGWEAEGETKRVVSKGDNVSVSEGQC